MSAVSERSSGEHILPELRALLLAEPLPRVQGNVSSNPRLEPRAPFSVLVEAIPETTRYRFESQKFAYGGSSELFRGVHVRSGRQVMAKESNLGIEDTGASEEWEILRLEAIVMGRVTHPNILPILDYYSAEISPTGKPRIILPYLDPDTSPNLDQWRKKQERVDLSETMFLLAQLGSALDYLASKGIWHRDIKTKNAFLWHGVPVWADFGLSNWVVDPAQWKNFSPGKVSLQRLDSKYGEETFSSEVMAFTILAYELLVGKPFFSFRTSLLESVDAYEKWLTQRDHSSVDAELQVFAQRESLDQNRLQKIFARAFHKESDERFQTVYDFMYELSQALGCWERVKHVFPQKDQRMNSEINFSLPESQENYRKTRATVYVCAQGQERSVAAASIDNQLGRKESTYLPLGFYGFGENIKSTARNRVLGELNLFGKSLSGEEVIRVNKKIDEYAFSKLQEEMLSKLKKRTKKNPKEDLFLRIFYDEKSALADEFVRVVESLDIPYELITTPQFALEVQKAKEEGYALAGLEDHNWISVLDK